MGDTPTENLLKRHQHWLLAILSAFLLFLQLPECKPLSIGLGRDGTIFHCTHAGNRLEIRILDRLCNGVSVFRRSAPRYCTALSVREHLRYDDRLSAPCRLYGSLFCCFCRPNEVCAGAFRCAVSLSRLRAIWTALEWVRSWLITGFPWGSIGYSQWNNLIGIQVASVVGVHGISFVIVLLNAGIATVLSNRNQWRQEIRAVVLP